MSRRARTLASCLALVAALATSGCFNKEELVTLGETEGIYVTVGGLKYQVQLSRILNPASVDDQAYLRGLPAGEELADDEVWFGIFMRVENDGEDAHAAAEEFVISDTQDEEFEPLELDPEFNAFAYVPREIPSGELLPIVSSPASDSTIGGAVILFKVKTGSLYNRPLELEILSPEGGADGIVDLDV